MQFASCYGLVDRDLCCVSEMREVNRSAVETMRSFLIGRSFVRKSHGYTRWSCVTVESLIGMRLGSPIRG